METGENEEVLVLGSDEDDESGGEDGEREMEEKGDE